MKCYFVTILIAVYKVACRLKRLLTKELTFQVNKGNHKQAFQVNRPFCPRWALRERKSSHKYTTHSHSIPTQTKTRDKVTGEESPQHNHFTDGIHFRHDGSIDFQLGFLLFFFFRCSSIRSWKILKYKSLQNAETRDDFFF
jgi:hypothetical protein